MKPAILALLAFGFMILSCDGGESVDSPVDMNTYNLVVDRIRETYGNCRTYRDRATFTSDLPPRKGTFATAFQRVPRLFRFDNRIRLYSAEEDHTYVLTANGKTTLNKGDVSDERHNEGEVNTLAPTTGFFGPYIPELLMPDVFNGDFFTYLENTSMRTGDLDGENCYIIKGIRPSTFQYSPSPDERIVWVRRKDYLIIRIKKEDGLVDISPELNRPIDSKVFSPRGGGR